MAATKNKVPDWKREKIKKLLEYELGFIRNQAMILNKLWNLGDWINAPKNLIKQELFYKSMFNSFEQVTQFLLSNGIYGEFKSRILNILEETSLQKWENAPEFEQIVSRLEF